MNVSSAEKRFAISVQGNVLCKLLYLTREGDRNPPILDLFVY